MRVFKAQNQCNKLFFGSTIISCFHSSPEERRGSGDIRGFIEEENEIERQLSACAWSATEDGSLESASQDVTPFSRGLLVPARRIGLGCNGLLTSGASSGKWFSRWMSLTGKDHTHRAHPCSQPERRNILDCDSSQKVRGFTGFAHSVVDSLQNGRCTLSRFLLIPIQAATPTRNSCRIFLWLA